MNQKRKYLKFTKEQLDIQSDFMITSYYIISDKKLIKLIKEILIKMTREKIE